MNDNMSTLNNNIIPSISVLFSYRRVLIFLGVFSLIVSIVATITMPNYYRSTAIFYPSSMDLAKPEQIFQNSGKATDYYGTAEDLDRLLSLGESEEMKSYLISKFDLYKHYKIDSISEKGPFYVNEILNSLMSVQKTKYDAVQISVEDKDPKFAKAIANAAVNYIDSISVMMIKGSQKKMVELFETKLFNTQKVLDSLRGNMNSSRKKFGIYDLRTESQLITELSIRTEADLAAMRARLISLEANPIIPRDTIAYVKANVRGLEKRLQSLTSSNQGNSTHNLSKLNEGYIKVWMDQETHNNQFNLRVGDLDRYAKIKSAYESPYSAIHMVQQARIPLNKSRPKRAILVIVSFLGTMLFSSLGILLWENYKQKS
jgi:tyrosine-protein kinase Etk/Wzc